MKNLPGKCISLSIVIGVILVAGCAGQNDLADGPKVVRKKITQTAERAPESKIRFGFDENEMETAISAYDPKGRIDPFKPFVSVAVDEGNGKTKIRPVDLSRYTLTGIILAPRGNRALVRDASGKGLIVSEGENLGISDTVRVAEILNDRVFVDTEVEDAFQPGKMSTVRRELKLQKPFSVQRDS